jgi:hypothetical protein
MLFSARAKGKRAIIAIEMIDESIEEADKKN